MANELLQAVTVNPYDPTKTLLDTFASVADRNMKARELEVKQQQFAQESILKAADLELRRKTLALRAMESGVKIEGMGALSELRAAQLQKVQQGFQEQRDYRAAVEEAADPDGRTLADRLNSPDAGEADTAYKVFTRIQDKFRSSVSPVVNADIKAMKDLPYVRAKLSLAQKKEETRAAEAERKMGQGDRRLDQSANVLDETISHHVATEGTSQQNADTAAGRATETGRHNVVAEGQGQQKITETGRHNTVAEGQGAQRVGVAISNSETSRAGQLETVRHHTVAEGQRATGLGIGQQNANTRAQNSANRAATTGSKASAGMSLNLPSIGPVSMDKIRRVLARGMAPGATDQENTDAQVMRKSILAIPSGQKDLRTGSALPRYTNAEIEQWTKEGETVEPDLPTNGATTPPVAAPAAIIPGVSMPGAPAATPAPAPGGSSAVDQLLKKYKIPSRTPTGMATPGPGADNMLAATQNLLAGIGVLPQSPQPVGFGGFGLPPA